MAKIPGTIPLGGTIAPTDSEDVYATHIANYGLGGLHHVDTIAERNAITAERRVEGMLCTVMDDGNGESKIYQLVGGVDNANWQVLASGSGGSGAPGAPGKDGVDGKSAYDLAVEHGFDGTEAEWLDSITKIQLAEPALDWANVVDVTAAATTEGNYTVRQFTAPADGLVVFACTGASKSISQASSATGLVISVNGYTTQAGNIHRSSSTMALSQRVSKGDVVRCLFITGDATFNALKLVPVKASNALLRTYNITEADTGKLWIDGKAIYRITWEGNASNTTGAWNTLKAVPGVDKVISLSGVFSAGPNFFIPANYYTEATSMGLVAYSNGNLVEYHASNAYSGKPLRVIFEYTKA